VPHIVYGLVSGGSRCMIRGHTRSIVWLSTSLASPKSATLTIGGLSVVSRMFYK
jgi:hypothetical protein